jgi:DNA-binding NarL/FixJ family response regulator
MPAQIRVAILDDHQSIIDGYQYRLSFVPEIEVVGTACFGDELMPMLARQPVDVLLLDVNVPTSPGDASPYPILHVIPQILQTHPALGVLVISMHLERSLIKAVVEAGANGYVLKDDQAAIRELGGIVRAVANGGIYFSQSAHQQLLKRQAGDPGSGLTSRQLEALSLCAAYPDASTAELARKLGVANSTLRNLLSNAYLRLNVNHRAAAIQKARHMGLITPPISPPLVS